MNEKVGEKLNDERNSDLNDQKGIKPVRKSENKLKNGPDRKTIGKKEQTALDANKKIGNFDISDEKIKHSGKVSGDVVGINKRIHTSVKNTDKKPYSIPDRSISDKNDNANDAFQNYSSKNGHRFEIRIRSTRSKTEKTKSLPFKARRSITASPKKKKSLSIPISNLFKFIKKEKIIQHSIEDEKISGITFPANAIIYELGKSIQSIRSYIRNEKLTYIKFHDTLKPSIHENHDKVQCRNSLKRLPVILDYDEDSEIYWDDITDGESINYATNSEESETDSLTYSWIDEGDNELITKPKNLKFKLVFCDTDICFIKNPHKYDFDE